MHPAALAFLTLLTTPDAPRALDAVEVRVSRLRAVPLLATPASVSVVDLDADPARPGVHLAEALAGVPGLLARDRQNYGQDTQLSIRGFGARATFGVRGLKLYADGIPATQPDGQGQVAHFPLLAGDRIEVLRGPFAVLYGNSAGGVLQFWSVLPRTDAGADQLLRAGAGSHGTRSGGARLLARTAEGFGLNASGSAFRTDGFRAHSAARRQQAQLLGALELADGLVRLTGLLQHYDAPDAQDPLGLTWDQVRADPRQAPLALQFDTRKSVRQDQAGLRLEVDGTDGHGLWLQSWAGRRTVDQFLAIPVATQANPLHAGGVIDLDSDYAGVDARWTWSRGDWQWVLGGQLETLKQQRRGFENFVGSQLGQRGALRRDERNRVRGSDVYAQLWWSFAPRWSLLAGLRHSDTAFRSDDRYIRAGNPDDSGRRDYRDSTPVLGLGFRPLPTLRLHVALGRGFETPTFNELGYRADGGAGLALDLDAARSRHAELGLKWQPEAGTGQAQALRLLALDAALFRSDSDDELAVARNAAGRSSFRNVGRARRQGFELAAQLGLAPRWRLDLALTRLDARFRDSFPVCSAVPCTTPDVRVAAGTRLPGLPRDLGFARLAWQSPTFAWQLALETQGVGAVTANDAGTAHAAGYGLLTLEAIRSFGALAQWRAAVRLDNLLDRAHIGSVIVNEANSRFYEPGSGRTLWLGLEWRSDQ